MASSQLPWVCQCYINVTNYKRTTQMSINHYNMTSGLVLANGTNYCRRPAKPQRFCYLIQRKKVVLSSSEGDRHGSWVFLLTAWLSCSWPGSAAAPADHPPSTGYQTSPSPPGQTCGTWDPSEKRCIPLWKERMGSDHFCGTIRCCGTR